MNEKTDQMNWKDLFPKENRYYEADGGRLYNGNSIEVLKKMEENSVDTMITDPPYGLSNISEKKIRETMMKWLSGEDDYIPGGSGFMGKDWDAFVPPPALWKEVYRVMKPGGTILVFAGTRTQDLMSMSLRLAGFEIKDTILWIYGQGFPKSLNIAKNIRKQFDKQLENMYNEYKKDMYLWHKKLKNVNIADKIFQKNQIEVGNNIVKNDFVVVNADLITSKKISHLLDVIIVESGLKEANRLLGKNITIAPENVEAKQKQKLLNANGVERNLEVQNPINQNSVLKNVTIYQCGKIRDKIREEEAQRIGRGKVLSSRETIINVNYVEVVKILKHIILNQSKTFRNLDTKSQMELLTAINVIITKSTMECLITKMVNILGKKEKEWEGYGTALKPAFEPIILAIKSPEGTYANNALKWGVSGLWIDGGRIETKPRKTGTKPTSDNPTGTGNTLVGSSKNRQAEYDKQNKGRFPANIILECICDEVREGKIKPERIGRKGGNKGSFGAWAGSTENSIGRWPADKQIIHTNPECPCYMLDQQSGELGLSCGGGNGNAVSIFGTDTSKNREKGRVGFGDKGGASRYFKVIQNNKEENLWNNLNVNNAENNLLITNLIEKIINIISALKNVPPNFDLVNQNLNALFVGKKSKNTEIDFVQRIVAIKEAPEDLLSQKELEVIQDFMRDYKNFIQNQKSVDVERWGNIDITQITINLLKLCGYVLLATEENTNLDTKEVAAQKSEPKRFLYCAKASKKERNNFGEMYKLKSDVPEKIKEEIKKYLTTIKDNDIL